MEWRTGYINIHLREHHVLIKFLTEFQKKSYFFLNFKYHESFALLFFSITLGENDKVINNKGSDENIAPMLKNWINVNKIAM